MKFILDGSAEVMLQPQRAKIVDLLRSKGPMFVEQIARETGVHPRLVSHHLDVLEKWHLVSSKYEIKRVEGSNRELAVRMCQATPHVDDVAKNIKESI